MQITFREDSFQQSSDCYSIKDIFKAWEKAVVFTVTIMLVEMDHISILNSPSIVTLFHTVITSFSGVKRKKMSVFSQN